MTYGRRFTRIVVNKNIIRFYFDNETMREVPASWYPSIIKAGPKQWHRYRLDNKGSGAIWPGIPSRDPDGFGISAYNVSQGYPEYGVDVRSSRQEATELLNAQIDEILES